MTVALATGVAPTDASRRLLALGGLRLEGSDFDRAKPLLLLCYLCVEGATERRHLAGLLWPRAANPLASLSTELSRLRRFAGGVVDADATHARSRVPSDVQGFLDAVDRNDFAAAVELYTGEFLDGIRLRDTAGDLEEWLYATREFLAGRACDAHLGLGERAAARGDFGEGARCAVRACDHHELAAMDFEQLQRAHRLLLAADHPWSARVATEARDLGPRLDPTGAASRRRLRPLLERNRRPTFATKFVGRGAEIRDIGRLLIRERARLVTIAGLPGMGKTRLAVEALAALPQDAVGGDAHLVWLETATSPDEVPTQIANAIGVALRGPEDAVEQIARALGDAPTRILLDNFEHVMGAALLLSELLARCPRLTLLVTSRERLNLTEERVVWLGGLPLVADADEPRSEGIGPAEGAGDAGGALELFVARARHVDVNFALTDEDRRAVANLCDLVGGIPLAIELAATWVRTMPCSEIASRLQGNLDVLSTRLRDVPQRHRSLAAALESSWQLLEPEQRRALERLTVFFGGFGRDGAAAVADVGLTVLLSLVDASLLRMDANGRFERHPLVYRFAAAKMAARSAERAHLQRRHADHHLRLLEGFGPGGEELRRASERERLGRDLENHRIAWSFWLERGDRDAVRRAAPVLWTFFDLSGRSAEGLQLFRLATERIVEPSDLRVELLRERAQLGYRLGRYEEALALVREGIAISRRIGSDRLVSILNVAGTVHQVLRRLEPARRCLEEALTLTRADTDPTLRARLLTNLASVEKSAGDVERARAHFRESLDIKRRQGDDAGLARTLYNYASLLKGEGAFAEAEAAVQECLRLCTDLDYRPLEAYARVLAGNLHLGAGDAAAARRNLLRGARLAVAVNDPLNIATALVYLGRALAEIRPEHAAELLGAAETRYRTLRRDPLERDDDYLAIAATIRHRLGADAFAEAKRRGEGRSLEQLLAFDPGASRA